MPKVSDLGEFGLIEHLTGFIKNEDPTILRDFGDDTAFIRDGDGYLLLTVDTLVEGVHFLRRYPPEAVGWKLVSVNVSDIAAKGGKPLYGLITLALPKETELSYIEGVYKGISEALKFYRFSLVGGNTTSSERICLDLSLVGRAKRAIFRDGLKEGLKLFVSGPLGDSRAGLEILLSGKEELADHERVLVEKHLKPTARLDLSPIVEKYAVASMDISDGLLSDLKKMAKNFDVLLKVGNLPLSEELKEYCHRKGCDPRKYALLGGEDYELLVASDRDLTEFGFTLIGEVLKRSGTPKVFDEREKPLEGEGFNHLTPR